MSNPGNNKFVTYAITAMIEVEDNAMTPENWSSRWVQENLTAIKILGATPVKQGFINWEALDGTDPMMERAMFPVALDSNDRVIRMSHKDCKHEATCWERRKCKRARNAELVALL